MPDPPSLSRHDNESATRCQRWLTISEFTMRYILVVVLFLAVTLGGCHDNFPPGPMIDQGTFGEIDWRLESFEDLVSSTVEKVGDSIDINLRFRTDGTFQGYTGCSVYGGDYRVAGDTMRLTGSWTGKTLCRQDNRFEEPYLNALPGVMKYQATVGTLRLYYQEGSKVLNFVRIVTTPKPTRVVYVRASATSFGQGYLVSSNLDGSDVVVLDSNAVLYSQPSHGTIAYSAGGLGNSIVVAGIDGTNRIVKQIASNAIDNWVVLSPDGARIALDLRGSSGAYGTYLDVADLDMSNVVALAESISQDALPVFSPDGKQIAFFGGDDNLYVVPRDGSSMPTVIADNVARVTPYVAQPLLSWSPDGRAIAYTGQPVNGPSPYTPELFVVNADGTGRRRLTADSGESYFPAWSPDGKWIAFSCNGRLCRIPADGSGPRENLLALSNRYVLYPEWSDDGERILMILQDGAIGPATYGRIAGSLVMFDLKTGTHETIAEDVYTGFWAY